MSGALTILSIIPRHTPISGGHATTAARVASQLATFGWETILIREGDPLPLGDVILAWNAVQVGERLLQAGVDPQRLVVVWTGPDLWEGLNQDPNVLTRLESVGSHVVFTKTGRERLLERVPHWADRIHIITPGVEDTMFRPGRGAASQAVILVAGGIRTTKRTHWAIDLVDRVRSRGLAVELWIAGTVWDLAEAQLVMDRQATRPWVRLWGEVSQNMMPSLYCHATVVLNTSAVEGMSNVLMEAMACGAAVVAARIPGNAALIQHGETGWLFSDADEFDTLIHRVMTDRVLRQQIGHAARKRMVTEHGAFREGALYAHMLGQQIAHLFV